MKLQILLLLAMTLLSRAASPMPLKDKTLVVWAAPANVSQRGGSALTIEKSGGAFDAVVFGELAPAKWMAGSDGFSRTQKEQSAFPVEAGSRENCVQIAIVYRGREVLLYRDGKEVTHYEISSAETFPADSFVLMGLRHTTAAAQNRFFVGTIDDARIYDFALSAEQIAGLTANQSSEPKPIAWWDFEEGRVGDRIQSFATTSLLGDARVRDGKLRLDSEGAYLLATKEAPRPRPGDANASARALREKLLQDPYRAGYHFVTPGGTCMPFDPNGAIFWKGRYHLFYIFQDERGHNWGHVSSTDLFHWRHHPTGLVSGMFSGNCFINKDGRPTMCYHQVGQGNAMAVAVDDDLNEWKKLESNPITPKTKPGDPFHDKYRSWDPYAWIEDGNYYAIFGGEHPGLARSPTLDGEWKYVGDFLGNTVPGVSRNEDVSCADFFRLGDKRMLLCISHRLGCRYYLGDWRDEQFHPTFHSMMSWTDNSFFAPESLLDDRGRRIMWAWIFDGPGFKMRTDSGWSGTMSLPRVLSLAADGTLRMEPPAEIASLRYNARTREDVKVEANTELPLEGFQGNIMEFACVIEAGQADRYGVKVCVSPKGEEQTAIYYDAAKQVLTVDTSKSSVGDGPRTVEAAPLILGPEEPLSLRVFVDKSVVEVFANGGRQAVMRRIYPARPDSLGVTVFSTGAPARVTSVKMWDIMPANPY